MSAVDSYAAAYERHKNLKLAADELGIKWQTLYFQLRRAGVAVTGDKARHGSDKDKLARKSELLFASVVPFARDLNEIKYQPKTDFEIGRITADVKASRLNSGGPMTKSKRWAFSVKKQEMTADFFVCAAFDPDESVAHWLVIPGEIARNYQTISVSMNGSKWLDYKVDESDLAEFFMEVSR